MKHVKYLADSQKDLVVQDSGVLNTPSASGADGSGLTNVRESAKAFNRRDVLKGSLSSLAGAFALGSIGGGIGLGGLFSSAQAASKPFRLPSRSNPLLLNFNESAYGHSNLVDRGLVRELSNISLYPVKAEETLKTSIAKFYGLRDDRVSVTNGSSAAIQSIVYMANRLAREQDSGLRVILPDPTFEFIESYAKPLDADIIKVPLDSNFNFNIDDMKSAEREFDGVSLVYICNPNNPTSNVVNPNDLYSWIRSAKSSTLFLLDEAYVEFITDLNFKSGIDMIKEGVKNVIVTRTFSKAYGLAALRIGYIISTFELQKRVGEFLELVGINLLGAFAADVSLKDFGFRQYVVSSNLKSRQIVKKGLDSLGLKYAPSFGNFIFHEIGVDFDSFTKSMLERNIVVGRKFDRYDNYCRVTLGTPEQMAHYVDTLKQLRGKRLV